jgi:hypothetical protein
MKKILSASVFCAALLFSSCKKSAEDNVQETVQNGTTLKTGTFVSNSKTTSGTAKIVRGSDNIVRLVFENLSTGNGPDVRVWLSPNTTGSPRQDLGLLKAVTGTFSYELSSSIDYTTNNRVLIWCVDFAVLFGHAVLQ